jgi:poly-D-alanine transfer protein DltD
MKKKLIISLIAFVVFLIVITLSNPEAVKQGYEEGKTSSIQKSVADAIQKTC